MLWVGIFNLMIVAQFWSFANDLYTRDQGERLFPIVAFGASLGAVLGSVIARGLIPLLGVPQLLLVAAGMLALATMLSNLVDRRERARNEAGIPLRFTTAEIPAATGEYLVQSSANTDRLTVSLPGTSTRPGTFRLVFGERYLLLIALMILMLNWVNSTGEYILSGTVKGAAEAAIAAGTAGGLSVGEYIGAVLLDVLLRGEPGGPHPAAVRGLPPVQVLRGAHGGPGAAHHRPDGLYLACLPSDPGGGSVGEDRRKCHRLLAAEHGAERPLSAHQPGAEVQGQAGH